MTKEDTIVDTKDLLKVFELYSCHTDMPDKTETATIVFHISKAYYENIIYSFPPEYIAIVLKYFEYKGQFEICASIKRRIENHNKINSDNIKTKLEAC